MPVTLEKVKKGMRDFPQELQMYCYHHMNGRLDEAQTYLDAHHDMQDGIKEELTTVEENEYISDDDDDKEIRHIMSMLYPHDQQCINDSVNHFFMSGGSLCEYDDDNKEIK
jgi:hypothetical protein